MNKIVIVGCGNVGMAYAYSLVVSGAAVDELVLIDINKQKAEGEVLDLYHALTYAPKTMKIKCGEYSNCKGADIVCICAGVGQKVGETRRDLLSRNVNVFKSIITEINKTKFAGVYLIATNPLDVLTYATMKLSGFKPSKVLGTGTTLDTARLKYHIGKKLKVSPKEIHAYVLGEHGDSEFVAWGNATFGGNLCADYFSKKEMEIISNDVRTSAYDIINKKGNTSYGIGMCLLKITNAIIHNQKTVLTVSSYDAKNDCYFSKPVIVGKSGVVKELYIKLNDSESKKLENSINSIKNDIKNVGLNNC
ncbi:MAG: L-lactate dehydrogenase [Clostridia bacterium]|nr:L-lactate dehydrogenase [Clostridia bacterium]